MKEINDSPTRAEVLLRESLTLLAPLARALVSNGVPYPVFAQALKQVFLEAARHELTTQQKKITDSALSLLSGVHRKDVRAMARSEDDELIKRKPLSLSAELVTRWLTDPTYQDADGRPLPLPLRAKEENQLSFERLSQSISKDFHARSMLEELLRLQVIKLEADIVTLISDAFVPEAGFVERAFFAGQNLRDHLAAVAANINADGQAPFLEYAVYADDLSPSSVLELHVLARKLWLNAFRRMAAEAARLEQRDKALPLDARQQRMRFGVYYYNDQMQPVTAQRDTDDDSSAPV